MKMVLQFRVLTNTGSEAVPPALDQNFQIKESAAKRNKKPRDALKFILTVLMRKNRMTDPKRRVRVKK
jgi:hypothetical protein